MALRTYVPINDPNPDCVQYYIVEYKAPSDIGYTTAPVAYSSPAVIDGLIDGVTYSIKITKVCCDGNLSTPVTTNYTPDPSLMMFDIRVINSSTNEQSILVLAHINDPLQTPIVPSPYTATLGASSSVDSGSFPLSNLTAQPMSGDITLQNVGSVSFNYAIAVLDGSGTPISGSDAPTATIVPGNVDGFNPFAYGASPDDYYRLEITLTDI